MRNAGHIGAPASAEGIRTGEYPRELIFDSRLTTHSKLNELNQRQIFFITLRKRTPKLMEELNSKARSAWRKIELSGVSRMHRSPRILIAC